MLRGNLTPNPLPSGGRGADGERPGTVVPGRRGVGEGFMRFPMRRYALTLVLLVAATGLLTSADPPRKTDVVLTDAAAAVHREALLVDGHNDLPYELRRKDGTAFRNIDLLKPQPRFHTDIPRL